MSHTVQIFKHMTCVENSSVVYISSTVINYLRIITVNLAQVESVGTEEIAST